MGNVIRRILPCKREQEKQADKAERTDTLTVPSGVSEDAIRKIVDTFMKNSKINQRFIPDAIERQIYQNVIVLLMAVLEESLKTAQIQFMGHALTVHIAVPEQPSSDTSSENTQ